MVATLINETKTEEIESKWIALARELGPGFASRAAIHDSEGTFVAENYELMRRHKLFSAAIPAELGGGGASHSDISRVIRELGRHDGSTALAFAMHSHLLAALVWRYRHQLTPSSEPVLRKIAAEELVLVSTGGSDWLEGSGTAVKVEGGFSISGRKVFSSGSPGGNLLLTTAVYDDPEDGPVVLHLAVNLKGDGVTILDDWNTLGMRGTGSNSVVLENIFVPEAGISLRRPQGKWHPFFDIISPIAWSLVMSAYVGVAEGARDQAVSLSAKKQEDPGVQYLIGEMDTQLAMAQLALEGMIGMGASDAPPSLTNSNRIYQYKTIAVKSSIQTVEKAMMVVGGASYYRGLGLERALRDVQASRYHPFQEHKQYVFSGRVALGLDPVE
ncbi:MAG: acyl-CoA dehydrogenase family protein [Dehalococcoidia bacterium]